MLKYTWVRVGAGVANDRWRVYINPIKLVYCYCQVPKFYVGGTRAPSLDIHLSSTTYIHLSIHPSLSPKGNGTSESPFLAHFCLHSCISLWDLCVFTQSLKYFIQSHRIESMPILFTFQQIFPFSLCLRWKLFLNRFWIHSQFQNQLWDTFINHRELWKPWASVAL